MCQLYLWPIHRHLQMIQWCPILFGRHHQEIVNSGSIFLLTPKRCGNSLTMVSTLRLVNIVGLFHGVVPHGTSGLFDAIALFRGLKRPRIDVLGDELIYIYVTAPPCSYIYPHETQYDAEGPMRVESPLRAIFTTFVEFSDPAIKRECRAIKTLGGEDVHGIVQFWEWTLCSEDDATLPRDHATRYLERVW